MARINVTASLLGPSVRVGDRDVPQRYEMVWTPGDDETGPAARFVFEVIGGVPQCRGVHLESTERGREIRRADLDLPLEHYLELATISVGLLPGASITNGERVEIDLADPYRRQVQQARRTNLRHGPSDDELRQAVTVYEATAHAPTQAVADKFGIAHRTASLWIKRAREAGML